MVRNLKTAFSAACEPTTVREPTAARDLTAARVRQRHGIEQLHVTEQRLTSSLPASAKTKTGVALAVFALHQQQWSETVRQHLWGAAPRRSQGRNSAPIFNRERKSKSSTPRMFTAVVVACMLSLGFVIHTTKKCEGTFGPKTSRLILAHVGPHVGPCWDHGGPFSRP